MSQGLSDEVHYMWTPIPSPSFIITIVQSGTHSHPVLLHSKIVTGRLVPTRFTTLCKHRKKILKLLLPDITQISFPL
jgi:hypothetical protein